MADKHIIILDSSSEPFVIEGALTAKYGCVRVRQYADSSNRQECVGRIHLCCDCCKNLAPREMNLLKPIACSDKMRNILVRCPICTIDYPLN